MHFVLVNKSMYQKQMSRNITFLSNLRISACKSNQFRTIQTKNKNKNKIKLQPERYAIGEI